MPVTVPGIMGALVPNLASYSMLGTGVPKYSRGVALGLQQWIPKIKVTTTDTGTSGVGKNVPLPLFVPFPILYANIFSAMRSQGLKGVVMPAFVMGLTQGLVTAFAQMLVSTQHPSVGVGAGVAKFVAPPATRSILAGFQQAGLKGDGASKKARALGAALDRTFTSLIMPIVIAGPSSPFAGAGTGTGRII